MGFGKSRDKVESAAIIPQSMSPSRTAFSVSGLAELFAGRNAFNTNPYVRMAIHRLASDLSSIPFELYVDGEVQEPVGFGPAEQPNLAYRWLRKPNSAMSHRRLMFELMVDYFVWGRSFIQVSKDVVTDVPNEFRRISPMFMEAVVEGGKVIQWRRRREAFDNPSVPPLLNFEVTPEGESELFADLSYNPEQNFHPNPMLEAAKLAIECTDHSLTQCRNSLQSGLSAGALISAAPLANGVVPNTPNEQAAKDFKTALRDALTGGKKAGAIAVLLEQVLQVHEFGNTARESQQVELLNFISRIILQVYGVPAQLIGVNTEANSYANYQQAQRAFYEGVIVPRAEMFADSFSHYLTINTSADVEIRPKLADLPVYRDSRVARIKELESGGTQVATLDEKRELAGLDEATPEQREELLPAPIDFNQDGDQPDDPDEDE